jgi:hypothetical protein
MAPSGGRRPPGWPDAPDEGRNDGHDPADDREDPDDAEDVDEAAAGPGNDGAWPLRRVGRPRYRVVLKRRRRR